MEKHPVLSFDLIAPANNAPRVKGPPSGNHDDDETLDQYSTSCRQGYTGDELLEEDFGSFSSLAFLSDYQGPQGPRSGGDDLDALIAAQMEEVTPSGAEGLNAQPAGSGPAPPQPPSALDELRNSDDRIEIIRLGESNDRKVPKQKALESPIELVLGQLPRRKSDGFNALYHLAARCQVTVYNASFKGRNVLAFQVEGEDDARKILGWSGFMRCVSDTELLIAREQNPEVRETLVHWQTTPGWLGPKHPITVELCRGTTLAGDSDSAPPSASAVSLPTEPKRIKSGKRSTWPPGAEEGPVPWSSHPVKAPRSDGHKDPTHAVLGGRASDATSPPADGSRSSTPRASFQAGPRSLPSQHPAVLPLPNLTGPKSGPPFAQRGHVTQLGSHSPPPPPSYDATTSRLSPSVNVAVLPAGGVYRTPAHYYAVVTGGHVGQQAFSPPPPPPFRSPASPSKGSPMGTSSAASSPPASFTWAPSPTPIAVPGGGAAYYVAQPTTQIVVQHQPQSQAHPRSPGA